MIILGFETTCDLHESHDSVLYRATALDGSADVVLKMLKGAPSPQRLARFRQEFQTAQLFRSPGILTAIRQDQFVDTLVSIVEDFGAESLDKWIRRGRIALRDGLTIAIAICEGLSDVHSLGFVHNDIAPANILWNADTGAVKITDFGCSWRQERTVAVPRAPASWKARCPTCPRNGPAG